jgi:ABC-type transport system substrate-binding protein
VFAGLNRAVGVASLVAVLLLRGGETAADAQETVTVGVADFGEGLDVLGSPHPAALVVREAVGDTLLSLRRRSDGAPTKNQFELALADSVQVSPDFTRWSLRVRRGARFHSGRPISAEDVLFSLEQCTKNGGLRGVKKSVSRRDKTPYDALQEWVDLEVEADTRQALPRELARCPIWERQSALVFGRDFGQGVNFVGSGPFRVMEYRPGKQYTLARVGRSQHLEKTGASTVVVRGFHEPPRGLTALREGTLGVLFTSDPTVLGKSAKDETLVIFDCGGFKAVRRRELLISCEPSLDVARLRMGR